MIFFAYRNQGGPISTMSNDLALVMYSAATAVVATTCLSVSSTNSFMFAYSYASRQLQTNNAQDSIVKTCRKFHLALQYTAVCKTDIIPFCTVPFGNLYFLLRRLFCLHHFNMSIQLTAKFSDIRQSTLFRFVVDLHYCSHHKPCLNGGTCINSGLGFRCVCDANFTGATCERARCSTCFNAGLCDVSGLSTGQSVSLSTRVTRN